MIRMIARRVVWTIAVAWFVVTATFALVAAIPADPARTLAGPHATPDDLARVRAAYCLDRGVVARYVCYVDNVAHGDLGESYRTRRPVTDMLAAGAWPTAQLALAALVLQLLLGVPLGAIAAVRRGRWPDAAAGLAGLIGLSAPTFVVGSLLVWICAYRYGWFPIAGYGAGVCDRLAHLVLPGLALAAGGAAYYARLVRGELVAALASDHVRTARAKGVPERRVVWRHGLRAALGPLVTFAGLDLGTLLGGAVVVESIFAWPGLGRELLRASSELDIPVILGVVLVGAIAISVANLLADLVVLWLDPRARE
jgi:ABC-type dipeptide/oligopeptide/nickel transport system permease component